MISSVGRQVALAQAAMLLQASSVIKTIVKDDVTDPRKENVCNDAPKEPESRQVRRARERREHKAQKI